MEKNTALPKEQKLLSRKNLKKLLLWKNAYDATKSSDHRYYHYFGYIDGIAWYCNRYDPVHLLLCLLVVVLTLWLCHKVSLKL